MIAAAQIETELGGDHHFPTERSKGFADEFFIEEWAVDLGGVKERDAAFHCGMEQFGHLFFVFGRAIRKAHAHAAETDRCNLQIAFSQFARLHCFFSCAVLRIPSLGPKALARVARSFRFIAYSSCE